MKTRHFIILGVFVILLGLIYIPIINKDKRDDPEEKPASLNYIAVKEIQNKSYRNTITAYGQIQPNQQMDVTMQVQGFLEREQRSLRPGMTFKKGDVLFKVERVDALYSIISRRSAFTNLITTILADIKIDYPQSLSKWEQFLTAVDPIKALPPLPEVTNKQEKLFINSRNIPSEYYAIKAAETQLDHYFYLAPFDGTVIASFAEPGSMVSPAMRLATIARTTGYEVKAPVPLRQLDLFLNAKSIGFHNPEGVLIGTGKSLRFSEALNQQTQSVDTYFSFVPLAGSKILQGMFVNLESDISFTEESAILPENAVRNNKVQTLQDSIIGEQTVEIISRKIDSVYVRGLPNGTRLILEPLTQLNGELRYVGIEK